jgi:hypothetical protein
MVLVGCIDEKPEKYSCKFTEGRQTYSKVALTSNGKIMWTYTLDIDRRNKNVLFTSGEGNNSRKEILPALISGDDIQFKINLIDGLAVGNINLKTGDMLLVSKGEVMTDRQRGICTKI